MTPTQYHFDLVVQSGSDEEWERIEKLSPSEQIKEVNGWITDAMADMGLFYYKVTPIKITENGINWNVFGIEPPEEDNQNNTQDDEKYNAEYWKEE